MKIKKEQLIFSGMIFLISFFLLFMGVRFVLGNEVTIQNLIVYLVFSAVIAFSAFILVFKKYKIAFYVFSVGVILGFLQMYRAFFNKMEGWGDLIGIISLLIFSIGGLFAGIIAQIIYNIYRGKKR